MAVLWRTRDQMGREVTPTEPGRSHMPAKHPEMPDRLGEIPAAVEEPPFATRPAGYPHRECFYRTLPGRRLRTKAAVNDRPVPPQGTWAAGVITAHRTARIGAEEDRVWP